MYPGNKWLTTRYRSTPTFLQLKALNEATPENDDYRKTVNLLVTAYAVWHETFAPKMRDLALRKSEAESKKWGYRYDHVEYEFNQISRWVLRCETKTWDASISEDQFDWIKSTAEWMYHGV